MAIILALAAAVPLAGCGSTLTERQGLQPIRSDPAPRIDAKALTGTTKVTNTSLQGRVVLINFWASTCGPCRTEMPALSRFAHAHPDLRVVGIAVLDTTTAARNFARKVGVDYELVNDPNGDNFARFGKFGATGLPSTFILDTRGRVARQIFGAIDEKDLANLTAGVE